MARNIGFVKAPQVWEGPVCLTFGLRQTFSPTARYDGSVEGRAFPFYVPYSMLPAMLRNEPPAVLHIAFVRGRETAHPAGLFPEEIVSGGPAIFAFYEDRERSKLYRLSVNRRYYSLYAPNEFFGSEEAPECLVVQVAVPRA